MGMKNRIVDIVLVVVILSAAGFIGYRYFMASEASRPTTAGPLDSNPIVTGPVVGLARETERPAHPQWLLVKVQPIESAAYDAVLAKHTGALVQLEETAGCASDSVPTPAVSLLDQVVAERVKKGELQFLFGFKQARCYKKNQKLSVLYYGNAESEPFVALLGDVTVESVVENEPSQMPEELLKLMGVSREEYNDFVGFRRPQGLKDIIVKFGSLQPAKATSGIVPLGFPRAEVVTAAEVPKLAASVPGLRVLDVRSADEYHAGHLQVQGVRNVPFVLPPSVPKEFAWNVLNRDVLQSKFDAMSVGQGAAPVLVYGDSVKDPRPLYAMADLIRLGYRQIYWLREGFSKR